MQFTYFACVLREPIYIMHIPKTAGLTLQGILRRRYKKPGDLQLFYTADDLQRGVELSSSPRVVMGHFRFGFHPPESGQVPYVTFLRDPVEQVISHYHYTFDHPEKFEALPAQAQSLLDFARGPYGYNLQTRFVSGIDVLEGREQEVLQLAKENLLRHFAQVGISEYFDLSLVMLAPLLGWPHAFYIRENKGLRRQQQPVSPAQRAELEHILHLDRKLYQFGLQLFYNQVNKQTALAWRLRVFQRLNRVFQALNPYYIRMKQLTGA